MSAPEFFTIADGWLSGAARLPSPNCNERPPGVEISLLVIHNISLPPGEFGGGFIEQLFLNCLDCTMHPWFACLQGVAVSAHVFIDRHGSITQFVPFDRRAWHAGASSFGQREDCNDFSIGIELEGTDELPYAEAQYRSLVAITLALLQSYPALEVERIVGHCDIAPTRKTDPGPSFAWNYYRAMLRQCGDSMACAAGGNN